MSDQENKIPLCWATQSHDLVANALGYNTHNNAMKKFSEPYFEYTDKAEIALQICPADKFKPIPGKFNVMFTMWEFLDIPVCYIEGLQKADAVIVPSRFCKDIFSKYYPKKQIYVCNEGVDEEIFTYKERFFPELEKGKRFRFLWVGAPNPRKGYQFVNEMVRALSDCETVEFYLKTTMPKQNWTGTIKNVWKNRKKILFGDGEKERKSLWRRIRQIPKPYYNDRLTVFGKHKNVFFDTRKLSTADLVALYHSANVFLMPHMGEGWGLTLCEAMATGCPSISVAETGCKDFFDDTVGYALKSAIMEQDLKDNYDLPVARGWVPSSKDLLAKILHVMQNYNEAKKKALKGSERIRTKFTWSKAGERLRDVIDQIIDDRGIECLKQTSLESADKTSI